MHFALLFEVDIRRSLNDKEFNAIDDFAEDEFRNMDYKNIYFL